jgi:hypothetical protein
MNIHIPDRLAPYTISNYVTSPRKMSFQSWLSSPVMEIAYEPLITVIGIHITILY